MVLQAPLRPHYRLQDSVQRPEEATIPAGCVCGFGHKAHKPYHGAKPGSLENVWFGIKYTLDGSATGKRGEVEEPTVLINTAAGRAAVVK